MISVSFEPPQESKSSGVPSIRESITDQIRTRKSELKELEEIFGKKDEDKKKKDGLTVRQMYWLMLCASPIIGWGVSTMFVMSLLGIKANLEMLTRGFN